MTPGGQDTGQGAKGYALSSLHGETPVAPSWRGQISIRSFSFSPMTVSTRATKSSVRS